MIPKCFHRIWVGPHPRPANAEAYGRALLEHHPGWRLRDWSESDLGSLSNRAIYDSVEKYSGKANVARIGLMAETLARNGVLALVPVIAPFASSRAAVRDRHDRGGADFIEVHVATSVELCAARDVKGLYAKHRAGGLTGLTGVDAPYEAPADPDLRIETDQHSVEESVVSLRALLFQRGLA